MLRELLVWWIGQLADLVPENWRQTGVVGKDALVISPLAPPSTATEVSIGLRRQGRETPLGHFDLALGGHADLPASGLRQPAIIRLGRADVLSKTVRLPLAAERQLDQVLMFEMDQETPFSADDVYWNHRVLKRDRQRNQVLVRVMLVPRASLLNLLDVLSAAGIQPKWVEISDGPDTGCLLPLAAAGALAHPAPQHRLRWPAAVLCSGFALAAAIMPFVQQSAALSAIDREIADGRKAATEAGKLREEISRLSGTVDLVASERDKAGHPLAALAFLTRLIPDDTYLTELQQQQRKMTMSGRSASAARLIAALAASDQLRNPTFTAPITRLEGGRLELFTIALEIGS